MKTISEYGPLASIAAAILFIAGIDLYLAFTAGPGDCGFSHAGALLALLGR
jgi:hypothetical protein